MLATQNARQNATPNAMQNQPIRILLVDDHRSVLWGLEKLIESARPRMEVVAKATCGADAMAAVGAHQPDVVLLDLDLGDEDGRDLIPRIRERSEAKVIILTGLRDPAGRERAVSCGACGLVHKSEPAEVILEAIERVHGGELWLDRSTVARLFASLFGKAKNDPGDHQARAVDELTAAERRTIAAVVKYKSAPNKLIADAIHISGHTLRNHLASIYAKLGVHRRLDLVLYALEHGLDKHAA